MLDFEQINRKACFYRGRPNIRYTAQKYQVPVNPFVRPRASVPVSIQLSDTESIATPSIAPGSEVPETVEVRINPTGDPLAQAMVTLLPEQNDQMERAAIQRATVMLQSLTEGRDGEEAPR